DAQLRQLGFGSIVISDSEKVLALGGVMGGEHSGITDQTNTIVLESAVFDPKAIRYTVMKYGLRTESSHRYERSVDPVNSLNAAVLAVDLLKKYAGGGVSSEVVDIYKEEPVSIKVTVTKTKLDQYLGYQVTLDESTKILENLGFQK